MQGQESHPDQSWDGHGAQVVPRHVGCGAGSGRTQARLAGLRLARATPRPIPAGLPCAVDAKFPGNTNFVGVRLGWLTLDACNVVRWEPEFLGTDQDVVYVPMEGEKPFLLAGCHVGVGLCGTGVGGDDDLDALVARVASSGSLCNVKSGAVSQGDFEQATVDPVGEVAGAFAICQPDPSLLTLSNFRRHQVREARSTGIADGTRSCTWSRLRLMLAP